MLPPFARIARYGLLGSLCVFSLAGCASKYEGNFTGTLTEDASLSVVDEAGALRTIERDETKENVEVTLVAAEEPRVYDISMPGCEFQAMLFGSRLEIGGSKTCSIEVPGDAGWSGELVLTGNGHYEGGELVLEVTGNSADSGIGGSYRWTYRGTRKAG